MIGTSRLARTNHPSRNRLSMNPWLRTPSGERTIFLIFLDDETRKREPRDSRWVLAAARKFNFKYVVDDRRENSMVQTSSSLSTTVINDPCPYLSQPTVTISVTLSTRLDVFTLTIACLVPRTPRSRTFLAVASGAAARKRNSTENSPVRSH